ALREDPGECELLGSAALLSRELLDVPDQREVLFEVRALEARGVAPPVVGSQVLEALDLPRQEPAPEGAVGDEGDAELAAGGEDFVLRLAAPQRILGLQGADWVYTVRAANGGRSRFGEAEITHFALLDQPRHGAYRLLDRHAAVDPVLVIKVDGVQPEPLQAPLAGLPEVLGAAIHPGEAALRVAYVAELGREEHLAAAAADRLTHQFLVAALPVNVGSVQEIQAQIEGPLNGLDRLLIVPRPVEFRHAHASESQSGYGLIAVAQFAVLHRSFPP